MPRTKTNTKPTENGRLLRLSQAKRYIMHLAVSQNQSVFIWGPPGIGKSDVVKSIVADYKKRGKTAKLFDLRLSMCEPTDVMGIPYFNANTNQMNWAPPSLLPTQEDSENHDQLVLFLDEMNGAPPAVQAAAYQLILDRRVSTYQLPDNVAIIAARNRETDKGVTFRMPKPLSNRFVHFEVKENFDDWMDWAIDNNINPDVVGYLNFRKADLFRFDPKSSDRSFPTPRSWAFVSRLLEDTSAFDSEDKDDDIINMVSGAVGEGTALQFAAHRKTAALLPDPLAILQGKVKDLKTKEVSAMYSLATSIAYELKLQYDQIGKEVTQEQFDNMYNNVIGFWLDHFEPEMTVMSIRIVFKKYHIDTDGLRSLPNWREFFKRYGELIKKA